MLIVDKKADLIYLGIDVKMRIGKSRYQRDGFGWNQHMHSPYIYLSLGNLKINTRETQEIDIRNWVNNYVLSKIPQTGKIPHFDFFRRYLLSRIEKSLFACIHDEKTPYFQAKLNELVPKPGGKKLFQEKVLIMHQFFSDALMEC